MPDEPTPPPPPTAAMPGGPQPARPYPQQYPGYPAFAGTYAPPRHRSGWLWVAGTLGVLAILGTLIWGLFYTVIHSDDSTSSAFGKDSIGVIDIDGVILDAGKVDTQLDRFGDDDSVKAIILHINSPGGGAAASQEIYHEVLRIRREKHKKIIASVESVGASGAYYIASACDRIYANDASVVGSIRRHYGVDQLRRPDALGQAEVGRHPRRRT